MERLRNLSLSFTLFMICLILIPSVLAQNSSQISIDLIDPTNNKPLSYQENNINFNFRVSDPNPISNCSILLNGVKNQTTSFLYDDFSSEILDVNKWEVRQDTEGQPLMDEYWIDTDLENFHTKQNIIGDRRVYLFPKTTFTTGDKISYDSELLSREGNYGQMVLLTGDQYIRIGIFGYNGGVQGFDELGIAHIELTFEENNLHITRESPSGTILIDNLALTNANGTYELYVGSFTGHNGKAHIDFDNFILYPNKFRLLGEHSFTLSNLNSGRHSWGISCESENETINSSEQNLTILANLTFNNETDYPNLLNISDISVVPGFFVRNKHGLINWTEILDLSRGLDWAKFINLSWNKIDIDSINATELNGSATLALNNLTWTNPRILKNGAVCANCKIKSYLNGTITFNVSEFSIYETDETPIQTTSSGGGGGGGSSCTTEWICTNWSTCSNNLQTRVCEKEKESCDAGIKPIESQNCTVLLNEDVKEEKIEDDEFSNIKPGITGAATGTFTKPIIIIPALFLIGVIIVLILIRLRSRN